MNVHTLAVGPALDRRWADALVAFDTTMEVGVLGTVTRGDTVELQASLRDPYRQISRVFHLIGRARTLHA